MPLWTPPKVAAVASTYSATVLADSPIGYWRLGESSGTTAIDSSGNGHNGTYTPGSGSWTGGTLGQSGLIADPDTCALFNGSSGYVAEATVKSVFAGASHGTIEAWVNRTSASDTFEVGFNAVNGSRFEISWYSDGNIYWVAENGGSFGYGFCALGGTGTHHLVLAYDGTQGPTARIVAYIDAVAQSLSWPTTPATSLDSAANLGNFNIAHDVSASLFFAGEVDEVALYSTTLSSTRIAAHYAAGI